MFRPTVSWNDLEKPFHTVASKPDPNEKYHPAQAQAQARPQPQPQHLQNVQPNQAVQNAQYLSNAYPTLHNWVPISTQPPPTYLYAPNSFDAQPQSIVQSQPQTNKYDEIISKLQINMEQLQQEKLKSTKTLQIAAVSSFGIVFLLILVFLILIFVRISLKK